MEHFVTIFNNNYLPQGLCLYESLANNYKKFTLWVISLDEDLDKNLRKIGKKNIKVVSRKNFETDKLKRIKNQRTIAEYCWTLTPIAPKIIFNLESSVNRVTYVDADMFFFKNPKDAFIEFEESKKSILITEHDFDIDQEYKEKLSGKYIVQFVIFKKDSSEDLRKWWEDKCIEDCSSKISNLGIGDQKHLSEMYEKFQDKVHILKKNELFRSTWNYKKLVENDLSAWHFHGLKIINKKLIFLSSLESMPNNIFLKIYLPYLNYLKNNLKKHNIKVKQEKRQKNFFMNIIYSAYYFLIEKKIIKNSKYFSLRNI